MEFHGYVICTSATPTDEDSWVGGPEWLDFGTCLDEARKTPPDQTWALEREDRVRIAQSVTALGDELQVMRAQ